MKPRYMILKIKRNSYGIIFFLVTYFFQMIRGFAFIAKTPLQMIITSE